MKFDIRYLLFFLMATVCIVSIQGCQKEISYEGGGTGPIIKKCIACDYLPVCDSAEFVYIDSTANGIDTNRNIVTILGDTSINGLKFSKVSTLGLFGNGLLYNCDAQEYKVFINLAGLGINLQDVIDSLFVGLPFPPGTITAPASVVATILKPGAAAGATWKDVILKPNIPLVSVELAMVHTLKQKGITKNVLGKNYSDVIEMQSVIGLTVTGMPATEFMSLTIFYAKGVGIIQGTISNAGAVTQVRKLYSYKF